MLLFLDIRYTYISNGRNQTIPKHLSLAVKHLNGSAKRVNVLNELRYRVAHGVPLEYDTILVQIRLDTVNVLSIGIKKYFTSLGRDNIDFNNEILDGRSTTHNTNDIIIKSSHSDFLEENNCDT